MSGDLDGFSQSDRIAVPGQRLRCRLFKILQPTHCHRLQSLTLPGRADAIVMKVLPILTLLASLNRIEDLKKDLLELVMSAIDVWDAIQTNELKISIGISLDLAHRESGAPIDLTQHYRQATAMRQSWTTSPKPVPESLLSFPVFWLKKSQVSSSIIWVCLELDRRSPRRGLV